MEKVKRLASLYDYRYCSVALIAGDTCSCFSTVFCPRCKLEIALMRQMMVLLLFEPQKYFQTPHKTVGCFFFFLSGIHLSLFWPEVHWECLGRLLRGSPQNLLGKILGWPQLEKLMEYVGESGIRRNMLWDRIDSPLLEAFRSRNRLNRSHGLSERISLFCLGLLC